ncbi:hypothetical protein D3C85_1475920 [compost metagenome]
MASCLENRKDLMELLAGADLCKVTHLTCFGKFDVFFITLGECVTIQFNKISSFGWIKEIPIFTLLNTAHKFVA